MNTGFVIILTFIILLTSCLPVIMNNESPIKSSLPAIENQHPVITEGKNSYEGGRHHLDERQNLDMLYPEKTVTCTNLVEIKNDTTELKQLTKEPLKILFIGSSYFNYHNLPDLFENLAVTSGWDVYIDQQITNGLYLDDHAARNSTKAKIKEQTWDYIILQGGGRNMAYPDVFTDHPVYPALLTLRNMIVENCESTRIIFCLPWAFEDGMTWYDDWTDTYEDMQIKIFENTLQYAEDIGFEIAPVGWAWYAVLKENNYPLHYLHMSDWNHPSLHGSYLMACVIFSTVFLESSVETPFYSRLLQEEATYFQTVASEIVLENLSLWNIADKGKVFVDDDNTEGPWDGSVLHPFRHIQDAVDNTSEGNTIFVFDGFYNENIVMDKALILEGKNKTITIIDGNATDDVVLITADNTTLTGFTIQHSGTCEFDFGIELLSNNNTIIDNIIRDNGGLQGWTRGGIYLHNASYNTIGHNLISSNDREGLHLLRSHHNHIRDNQIYDNDYFALILDASHHNSIQSNDMNNNYVGMSFWPFSTNNQVIGNKISDHKYYSLSFYSLSDNNIVKYNTFSDNIEWSLRIAGANNNLIASNTISGSIGGSWGYGYGILLDYARNNSIANNNMMNNKKNAWLNNSFYNQWKGNYWDDHQRFGPKCIFGTITPFQNPSISIPWLNIDWKPASELNEIQPSLNVGPYTQNVTENAITIVWETTLPTESNSVLYGETTVYDQIAYGTSDCSHHEITINPVSSMGHYKVISDEIDSQDLQFELASHCNDTREFTCILFGDSRGSWDNWEHATLVANAVHNESPTIVIHGGDMVDDGRELAQWDNWLRLMKPVMQNATVFAAIGNHERKSSRYYEIFALPNNEIWYSFDYGPCHFIVLDNYEPWTVQSLQYKWLEEDLSSTEKPFKVVCFHEPLYCSGGHNPRADIRSVWEPLFNQYHVDLVVQSHCHYYQRTHPINGTIYVVTGGAGAPLYTPTDAWFVNLSNKSYHYCMLKVSLDAKEIGYIVKDTEGNVIDQMKFEIS